MKIENGAINAFTQLDTQLKKKSAPTVADTQKPARQTEEAFSVELSSKSEQLQKSQRSDEINSDRVAAIRDQLASGTYNISGKDVANKILGVLKG